MNQSKCLAVRDDENKIMYRRKRFGVAGPLSVTAAAGDLAANKLYQYREGFADKYLEANWRSGFHQDVIQLLTPDADIDLCAPGGLDIAKISHKDNGLSELWSEILSDLSRDMRDSRVATFKKSDTKFADNQLALQCCYFYRLLSKRTCLPYSLAERYMLGTLYHQVSELHLKPHSSS